jgi:predicted nucleic acid-binding protein
VRLTIVGDVFDLMAWLLDTNIFSEIRRLRPEPKVLAFIAG